MSTRSEYKGPAGVQGHPSGPERDPRGGRDEPSPGVSLKKHTGEAVRLSATVPRLTAVAAVVELLLHRGHPLSMISLKMTGTDLPVAADNPASLRTSFWFAV